MKRINDKSIVGSVSTLNQSPELETLRFSDDRSGSRGFGKQPEIKACLLPIGTFPSHHLEDLESHAKHGTAICTNCSGFNSHHGMNLLDLTHVG